MEIFFRIINTKYRLLIYFLLLIWLKYQNKTTAELFFISFMYNVLYIYSNVNYKEAFISEQINTKFLLFP